MTLEVWKIPYKTPPDRQKFIEDAADAASKGAKGYPAPQFEPATDANVVLHARWLHGNPDSHGKITYQAGLGYKFPCI